MEISPTGACNHRCSFCAFDYLEYKPRSIDSKILLNTLTELGKVGLKSVMYAGEGEPLLHKNIDHFIIHSKECGIDTSIATNGVLFDLEMSKKCLKHLSWMRVSLNAATPKMYRRIHGTKEKDFESVIENIKDAVNIKKENNLCCAIGVQCILLPENFNEIVNLAKLLKPIGIDYLTIKPFIKHLMSSHDIEKSFKYSELACLEKELEEFNSDSFKVVFRANAMTKLEKELRPYKKCLGLPFFAEILSNGDVYACGPYLGNKKFCYGNLYKRSFKEIWNGADREKVLNFVSNELDVQTCMKNCRLDEINRYLWGLTFEPPEHVNFI